MAVDVRTMEAISVEELRDGYGLLTVQLVESISAASLAKFLAGVDQLYLFLQREEVRDQSRMHGIEEMFASRSGAVAARDSAAYYEDLEIDRLEIGTPNKVRFKGAYSVLKKLKLLLETITLSVALFVPTNSTLHEQSDSTEQGQVFEQPQPCTPQERAEQMHTVFAYRDDVIRRYYNAEIGHHEMVEQVTYYDEAIREISNSCSIVRIQKP